MSTDKLESPLRKYRRAISATQEQLAGKIGVTPGQVSRIEREGTTSLPMALKLADVTGLPPAAFAPGAVAA